MNKPYNPTFDMMSSLFAIPCASLRPGPENRSNVCFAENMRFVSNVMNVHADSHFCALVILTCFCHAHD